MEQVESILTRLGMSLDKAASVDDVSWQVVAPSFRFDIAIESDLIEEIIRIHGYNNIPRKLPTYQPAMKPLIEAQVKLQQVKDAALFRACNSLVN